MLDAERTAAVSAPVQMDTLKRRMIMALGRACRHGFSSIIAKYSEVGDPPILANALFPWVGGLEKSWQTIRDEADAVLGHREYVPSLVTISPDHRGIADDRWKSFFLWGYGYRIDENCARCPKTSALLEGIRGLQTAFFSILEPGAHLTPHRGVTKAIFTTHLGLRVPQLQDLCWMTVDGREVHWREGEALVFDDTYEHEVQNLTRETRVVLLLHVKRPVRFPGSLIADFFLWCVRVSPFIQDALRNLEVWNAREKVEVTNL